MNDQKTIGVGIIGLGVRGVYSLGRNIIQTCQETGFRITAICDRNATRMVEVRERLVQAYRAQGVKLTPNLYDDGLALIHAPEVQLILITSITDSHRTFAIPALHSGKKVYCDKPLAHNVEDSIAIVEAEAEAHNPLIMGFTRRYETPWQRAYALLKDGVIGDLIMIQIRDIIPYHRYLTAWWRRRAWSGGALNDKGCHLFDVFNWFTEGRAKRVHGFGGKAVLQPDPSAPPRCSLCDRECPYRRRTTDGGPDVTWPHFGQSWLDETEEKYMDDVCVYAPGTDLYHNGSIHFAYESTAPQRPDVIASYFYSIFGPHAEDQETMELVGTKGRMILTRHTATIDIATDYGETHRVVDCREEGFNGSHFGADAALIRELRRFYDGAPPKVSAHAGLEATRMVMAALASMDESGTVVEMDDIPDISQAPSRHPIAP